MSADLLFIFVAVFSFVLLLFVALGSRKSRTSQRLAELSAGAATPAFDNRFILRQASQNTDRHLAERSQEEQQNKEWKTRLVQAGLYQRNAATVFALVRFGMLIALVGVGAVIGLLQLLPMHLSLLLGLAAGITGTIAPSFWLDIVKSRRQTQIRRSLPDALDLLGVCMAGGLSLTGALARVLRELGTAHPMLAAELAIVERESQMGRSTGEAMREFADRFDMEELRSLAAVVIQAEKFGSSLTRALEVYSETMRLKRRQRAEELAQKASIKILFPTLFCIFPGIFVVILGPAAIQIYRMLILSGVGR